LRFTSWYGAEQIAERAPARAGVFQVRAEQLRTYPTGRSAMVHYGCADDLRATMLEWARQHGFEGARYRHADVLAHSPADALAILLSRFVSRFGAPPSIG
jgi:hypothetical protein